MYRQEGKMVTGVQTDGYQQKILTMIKRSNQMKRKWNGEIKGKKIMKVAWEGNRAEEI